MTVWEAHKQLSEALGDACNVTASSVPDGARYFATLRNHCIYRAMLQIIADALKMVAGLPRPQAVDIISRLFPVSMVEKTVNTQGMYPAYYIFQTPDLSPAFITGVYALGQDGKTYSVPVKHNSIDAIKLVNNRNNQKHDTFALLSKLGNDTVINIYNDYEDLTNIYNIFYLPLPTIPDYQINMTNDLGVEPIFIPKMFSLATIYALTASQEIDVINQTIPMEISLGQISPQQKG